MNENKIEPVGYILIFTFLSMLIYAGYLSLKSIDFNVLNRMESHQLILPTPAPAQTSTSSTSPSPVKK